MDTNDQAAPAAEGEESFADMFEKSFKKQERLSPGQTIESVIVKISGEWIFLDMGGKGEGYLDRKELVDAEGKLTVKEGDKLRVYFVNTNNNEMHFTTKIGAGQGKQSQFEDASKNGLPVDGYVVKEMKGGFEVKLGGTTRAFCPFSQMGVRRDEKQADYVGKTLPFKIIEFAENGRNIVLSRRPLLDEEKRVKKQAWRETLQEGTKLRGTVTSIQSFGAFIDIGGLEGLLPISEIAWTRTEKVSDILSVGQQVDVIVKKIDWEKDRFSFSLKDALPDPWELVENTYPVGSYHSGKVSRLATFGAFVTLAEGLDGLVHISKLGGEKRIEHPREVVKEGQVIEVRIEAVDRANRKLSLSLASISRAEQEESDTVKDYKKQNVDTPQNMGSLGDMLKAKMDQKEK